jgi:hypothetical protein
MSEDAVRCCRCGRPFLDEERVALIAGRIMGMNAPTAITGARPVRCTRSACGEREDERAAAGWIGRAQGKRQVSGVLPGIQNACITLLRARARNTWHFGTSPKPVITRRNSV